MSVCFRQPYGAVPEPGSRDCYLPLPLQYIEQRAGSWVGSEIHLRMARSQYTRALIGRFGMLPFKSREEGQSGRTSWRVFDPGAVRRSVGHSLVGDWLGIGGGGVGVSARVGLLQLTEVAAALHVLHILFGGGMKVLISESEQVYGRGCAFRRLGSASGEVGGLGSLSAWVGEERQWISHHLMGLTWTHRYTRAGVILLYKILGVVPCLRDTRSGYRSLPINFPSLSSPQLQETTWQPRASSASS